MSSVEYQVLEESLIRLVLEKCSLVVYDQARVVTFECLCLDDGFDVLECLRRKFTEHLGRVSLSEHTVHKRSLGVLGDYEEQIVENASINLVLSSSSQETHEV
jgi:hypothetical protein